MSGLRSSAARRIAVTGRHNRYANLLVNDASPKSKTFTVPCSSTTTFGGFEIAMDAMLVCRLERVRDLPCDVERFGQGERRWLLPPEEKVAEFYCLAG